MGCSPGIVDSFPSPSGSKVSEFFVWRFRLTERSAVGQGQPSGFLAKRQCAEAPYLRTELRRGRPRSGWMHCLKCFRRAIAINDYREKQHVETTHGLNLPISVCCHMTTNPSKHRESVNGQHMRSGSANVAGSLKP